MDFLHDQLATGTKIRVLTVVDTVSRLSPVLDARAELPGRRCGPDARSGLFDDQLPGDDRCRPGQRVRLRDLDIRAYARDVTLNFSRPGKPTDNAFVEAFDSRVRAECMNAHWFLTLADAREKLEAWRRYPADAASPLPAV